jgi:hypothetical protein
MCRVERQEKSLVGADYIVVYDWRYTEGGRCVDGAGLTLIARCCSPS